MRMPLSFGVIEEGTTSIRARVFRILQSNQFWNVILTVIEFRRDNSSLSHVDCDTPVTTIAKIDGQESGSLSLGDTTPGTVSGLIDGERAQVTSCSQRNYDQSCSVLRPPPKANSLEKKPNQVKKLFR